MVHTQQFQRPDLVALLGGRTGLVYSASKRALRTSQKVSIFALLSNLAGISFCRRRPAISTSSASRLDLFFCARVCSVVSLGRMPYSTASYSRSRKSSR